MKNAIILYGGPDKKESYAPKAPSMSNAHWLPWLQGQLLKNEITASTPEVPYAFVEKKKQAKIDLLRKEDVGLPILLLDEQKFVTLVY